MFKVPEIHRVLDGPLASDASYGNNGAFEFVATETALVLCIASDGKGWEHVSVTLPHRPYREPRWHEMCAVKRMFWSEEDCVVQFHPPASSYVDVHPNCLHLWRKIDFEFPLPGKELV